MKRVRYVIYCAALFCAVIIAGWIVLGPRSRLQEQRLSDGSRVVLRRVTYGYSHRFPVGNFLQQLVGRVLPVKYAWRFPSLVYKDTLLVYNDTNDGPTLAVWIEHAGPTGNRYRQYGRLFDDTGTEFSESPQRYASEGGRSVSGYIFHALPSTSRELHFRLFREDIATGRQQTCLFTFPNPAFHPEAQKPAAYPLTLKQEKLTLVLNGFQPDPDRKERPNWMHLWFDVFENGQPATNWELHGLQVLDWKGAVYRPSASGWGHSENHTDMSFAGGLSTNAPWKLRFALKHATFDSNELCTVRNLPVGGTGETNLASVSFNGTTLVIGRGAESSQVRASILPPDENYYLNFVDILTADGRPFDRGKTYFWGQSDTNYSMGFPPGITNVDLVFGITRKVFIEGTAQPTPR